MTLSTHNTAQKIKVSIKDFFDKYNQIRNLFYWRKTSFFAQCNFLCSVRGTQVSQNPWQIQVKEYF